MNFQLGIEGKALGFIPVRVTPVDVKIDTDYRYFQLVAFKIDNTPISFRGFKGKLFARVK